MAELVDFEDNEEVGELEAVEQQQVEQAEQQVETKVEDDVPEQFKGKSLAEVAKYALATERRLSKQGQELGEIRRLTDELLRSQLTRQPEPEKRQEVDFFENPQEAIRQAVETNPRLVAAEQYAIQAQREQAKMTLAQMHPDVKDVVQDQGFREWVSASPMRVRMFQAAENYDLAAANELLSTYKELRSIKEQRQQQQREVEGEATRKAAMSAAAVDTGGSGESGRKIYRRAELIRLKMRDPAKYEAMQDDIMLAYQEGRVK